MQETTALARFHQALAQAHAALADALLKTPPAPAEGPMVDRLLPISAAAIRLGFSTTYIYRHAHELPFMRRHGRSWRVSQQGLDDYARTSGRRLDPVA